MEVPQGDQIIRFVRNGLEAVLNHDIFLSFIFNPFEKVTPQCGQVYGDSAGGYGAPSDSYGGGGGGGGASYAAPSSSYDARSSYDYRTVRCQIFKLSTI